MRAGGRASAAAVDATNVIDAPGRVRDHPDLASTTANCWATRWRRSPREKAGIIKPGVPVRDRRAADEAAARDRRATPPRSARRCSRAAATGDVERAARRAALRRRAGALDLPPPVAAGRAPDRQRRHRDRRAARRPAWRARGGDRAGVARAEWPARLQRLRGRLAALLPAGWELWLDGGHNPGAGVALARAPAALGATGRCTSIVGMKQTKDAGDFLRPLLPHAATVWAVAEPGQHLALPVEAIVAASGGVARAGPDRGGGAATRCRAMRRPARVLICGSLYLAGEVLKRDGA